MASRKKGGRIQGNPEARSYEEQEGRFWRGTDANIGRLGREISDALDGQPTTGWKQTRKKIWQQVASLIKQGVVDKDDFFGKLGIDRRGEDRNLALAIRRDMEKGKAPPCNESQALGDEPRNNKTNIDHIEPLNRGGMLHSLKNLLFTSPLNHDNQKGDEYHYGDYHGKKRLARREEREKKYQKQVSKKKRSWKERLFGTDEEQRAEIEKYGE